MLRTKFRFARLVDLAWLKRQDDGISKAVIKKLIEEKRYIVAELDSSLIGFLRFEYWYLEFPFLALIRVNKNYQGKEIGRSLLVFFEKYLKKKNYKKLFSSSDDSGAQKWHLKVGFKKSGYIENIQDAKEMIFFKKL